MKKINNDEIGIKIFAYIMVTIVAIVCLLPFWLMVAGSLTHEKEIITSGYAIIPKRISLDAYAMVFRIPEKVIKAYGVSIFVTFVGSVTSLLLTAVSAFVIMRKDFKYRNQFALFFYFPSIFSGGMLPTYLLVTQYLGLKDNLLALILPMLLNAWNIFLMRNFMNDIPDTIMESAKIDGANDFIIFAKLYLPLCKAGLATIGLFVALGYWNNWSNAMLYINKPDLHPLQYMLYQMLASVRALQELASNGGFAVPDMPNESFKMAMGVVTTGPILLLYPFVQRYFVKGLTVGAVKG